METNQTDFIEFPKIARLSREAIVTEKIDGTNAQILIDESGQIKAGSRNRWLTVATDNFGFAKWVEDNKSELPKLGPGRHFGEFWGCGIQRNYGLKEKRFSLFNVIRWCLHNEPPMRIHTADPRIEKYQEQLPACVGLVPVLWRGTFSTVACDHALNTLILDGSKAAPGYRFPEGIVIFHTHANIGFKKTIERDDEHKSKTMQQVPKETFA